MNPLKIAAQFAAFVWFSEIHQGHRQVERRALQYAREHWMAFLPTAHAGVGRLLIRLAKPRRRRPAIAQG